MSDNSDTVEQPAPAPAGGITGYFALPLWFRTAFYSVFIPFCLFAAFYISRSMVIQSQLTGAVATLVGDVGVEPSEAEMNEALDVLKARPAYAFQYLVQALLQDEITDARMARVLALQKAIDWGTMTARRRVVAQIVEHMDDDGAVSPDFEIDAEMLEILRGLYEERAAREDMTYAEDLVTEVVKWLAEGRKTRPKGPEKRRMQALARAYDKKVLVGDETDALADLQREWAASSDGAARSAAARFPAILDDEMTALTDQEAEYCRQAIVKLSDSYEEGMARVARAARDVGEVIIKEEHFLDHPYIYQYLSLVGYRYRADQPERFEDVRTAVAEGVMQFRHSRFAIRYLSFFAKKTAINPVMAVETMRLTKEEHEREMRGENMERVRRAIGLLGDVFVDYVGDPDQYGLNLASPRERDEYISAFIVHPLEELSDEHIPDVNVDELLERLRGTPGAERFFDAAVEQ